MHMYRGGENFGWQTGIPCARGAALLKYIFFQVSIWFTSVFNIILQIWFLVGFFERQYAAFLTNFASHHTDK